MKKKIIFLSILAFCISFSIAIGTYAATQIKLFIDGKQIQTDIKVFNGVSYVPLRVVSENIGAEVIWHDKAKEIEILSTPESQLLNAIYNDDVDKVSSIINSKVDLSYKNNSGESFLHVSITGDIEIIRLLLEAGIDPNIQNTKGQPIIFKAIMFGNYDAVKLLIEHGADLNQTYVGLNVEQYIEQARNEVVDSHKHKFEAMLTLVKPSNTDVIEISEKQSILNMLNKTYSKLFTSIGETSFAFEIDENATITFPWDYWLKIKYSNSFFYDVQYSNKLSEEQRSIVKQELKDHIKKIADNLIMAYPNKKFYGNYYDSWYRYPNLRVDLITRQYYTWQNYEGGFVSKYQDATPSYFRWYPNLDDEL